MSANKKNQFVTKITEKISENPDLSDTINLIIEILLVVFGVHILSCIHIFTGKYTYPGWIFKNEYQDFSYVKLYIISVYYLIQTMTTVGYGDVSSDSFIEINFRIILLAVGIICYSWIISNISNGINKQSYSSMNFSNDLFLLEKIRREHRELPFKVYSDIKNYLEYKHFHQNIYDKNLLINSLPYSLKNKLIFSMFTIEINNLKFFKGISNTNFLSEILYNFSSVICKKNEIVLNENEIIEQIFFVREGRLSLELPIDMECQEKSIHGYLSEHFMNYAFNFEKIDNFQLSESKITNHSISSLLEDKREIPLYHFKGEKLNKNSENSQIIYLKIYDIHKNEDYGGIYIFYGKRSPFEVKVKTKRAKIYTIKREEYSTICDNYKNIIKRIHKKEKKTLENIKNILIKTIDRFKDLNGIKKKEQQQNIINKAKKELKKDKLTENLLNSKLGINQINEIDEEINKTIKEFNNQANLFKSITLRKKRTNNGLKNNNQNQNNNSLNNLKRNRSSFNVQNLSNNKSTKLIKGFKTNYIDQLNNFKRNKSSFNVLNLINNNNTNLLKSFKTNNIGQLKINPFGKSYTKLKNKPLYKKNLNKTNESNKQNDIKNKSDTISDISISSIESVETVKINRNSTDNSDWPITLNELNISFQNKIKDKIQNNKLLNEKYNIFQVEHIHIEINNTKNSPYNNEKENNNIHKEILEEKNIKSDVNKKYKRSVTQKLKKNNNKNNEQKTTNIKAKIRKQNKSLMNLKNKSTKNSTLSPIYSSIYKMDDINSPTYSGKNKSKIKSMTGKYLQTNNTLEFSSKNNLPTFKNETILSTSADSFDIKRSYKNLNEITNGEYIKDKKFQSKTIEFIKDYKIKKQTMKKIKTKLTRYTKNNEK